MGTTARLRALTHAEAIAMHVPAKRDVPARQLFRSFELLGTTVTVDEQADDPRNTLADRYTAELGACSACIFRLEEARSNSFESDLVQQLEAWVLAPPRGCTLGLVEMVGYWQSFFYFKAVTETLIRPALAVSATTQREADALRALAAGIEGEVGPRLGVVSAPHAASATKLVGVQVRLGDKATDSKYFHLYAQTSWRYYQRAMRFLARTLQEEGATRVNFVVTAGGSMGSNAKDVEDAKQHLSGVSGRVHFSNARDPVVDLSILRGCDALVLGPSTLGWWAAWLAKLPAGHVVAPRHVINPNLPHDHKLQQGFNVSEYYPPEWLLLSNDGNGSIRAHRSQPTASPRSRAGALVLHGRQRKAARHVAVRQQVGKGERYMQPRRHHTFWEAVLTGISLVFRHVTAFVFIGVPAVAAGYTACRSLR